MSVLKLQSSEGEIIQVDCDLVKQMLTIQTMIDDLGDQDDDGVIPIPNVNSEVLHKIISWTQKYKEETDKESLLMWQHEYFHNEGVTKILEIILGADYLDVKSLMNESCRSILTKDDGKDLDEALEHFHTNRVAAFLEDYDREYGFDVIVTVIDDRDLKYFNPKTKEWVHITEIPDQFITGGYKLVGLQGKLYLIGGIGASIGNLTEYNPRTNTWRSVGNSWRFVSHGVCTLDNKIIIVWGSGEVSNVYEFDVSEKNVQKVTHTPNRHVDHVTLVMNNKVYVLGGCFVGVQGVNSDICEAYNVQQGQWESVADLSSPRMKAGGAVLDNKIYVAGGYNYHEVFRDVFCYDPASNTWSEVESMNKRRRGHSLVSLNGHLYAIGGGNIYRNILNSMEMYNPDTNTWEMIEVKLNGIADSSGACVMKRYYFQ